MRTTPVIAYKISLDYIIIILSSIFPELLKFKMCILSENATPRICVLYKNINMGGVSMETSCWRIC